MISFILLLIVGVTGIFITIFCLGIWLDTYIIRYFRSKKDVKRKEKENTEL